MATKFFVHIELPKFLQLNKHTMQSSSDKEIIDLTVEPAEMASVSVRSSPTVIDLTRETRTNAPFRPCFRAPTFGIPKSARGMYINYASMYPDKTAEIMTSRRDTKRGALEAFFVFGSPRMLFATGRYDQSIRCDRMAQLLQPSLVARHRLATPEAVKECFEDSIDVNRELLKPLYVVCYTDVRLLSRPIKLRLTQGSQAWQALSKDEKTALAACV